MDRVDCYNIKDSIFTHSVEGLQKLTNSKERLVNYPFHATCYFLLHLRSRYCWQPLQAAMLWFIEDRHTFKLIKKGRKNTYI